MSTENPREQEYQDPEQKEWPGQRLEYFSFSSRYFKVKKSMMFNIDDIPLNEALLPFARELGEKLKNLTQEEKERYGIDKDKRISFIPLDLVMNVLGSHGWELVAVTPSTELRHDAFFFKRPLPSIK